MAFINPEGKKISYECSELIEELKEDIAEFGGHTIVSVWCREEQGVVIYVNYDFNEAENPIKESEIEPDEFINQMTMTALLMLLEKQNEIL